MFAVRASGLTKAFESRTALEGVDLEVRPGEIRGLLGPNGAGKTTLLRMLFGLVRPDAGSVELFGRKVDGGDPTALEAKGRCNGYSTGMRQRLGIAAALLRAPVCCSWMSPRAVSIRPA